MKKCVKMICVSVIATALIIGGTITATAADMKTITTIGEGRVSVEPDVCYLNLFVRSTEKTAKAAKLENDKKVDSIVKALKDKGLTEEDIISEHMSLYPSYNYEKGREEIIGYEASQSMKITIKSIDSAGDFIDTAVNAGANINGISYSVLEREAAYIEALGAAVKNADIKAKGIANAMGISVKGPVSVVEGASYNGFVTYKNVEATMAADESFSMAKEAGSYLSHDNIEISATVTVIYEY